MHFHGHAIAQGQVEAGGAGLPHHRFERGVGVLERKVDMPGGRAREIRDLTLYPYILQGFILLQEFANGKGQLGDGEGL